MLEIRIELSLFYFIFLFFYFFLNLPALKAANVFLRSAFYQYKDCFVYGELRLCLFYGYTYFQAWSSARSEVLYSLKVRKSQCSEKEKSVCLVQDGSYKFWTDPAKSLGRILLEVGKDPANIEPARDTPQYRVQLLYSPRQILRDFSADLGCTCL